MAETPATDPTADTARQFIRHELRAFVSDPADSDFQRRYLACLYVVGREALGMEMEFDEAVTGATFKPLRAGLTVVK